MGAVDKAWSKDPNFYVSKAGKNAIGDRREGVGKFLETATEMRAPEMGVNKEGQVAFTDGRHRMAYLRDQGLGQVPVSMDKESIANAQAHGLLAGGASSASGPVKAALDTAGKRISEVAAEGPELNIAPVKDALRDMADKARPPALFQQAPATRGIGFTFVGRQPTAQMAATTAASVAGKPTANEVVNMQTKIAKAIAEQLGLPPEHPLPGILAKVQTAPDKVSFADAHQLKRLLDESVNWDRAAKKHLEGLTKGVRVALRQVMGAHEPYNAATAAYRDIAELTRKGTGKQFIQAAMTNPDRLATFLKGGQPEAAAAVRNLLVDTAAKGGDAAAGQRAWEAVRANHAYENLILGKPEQLEKRVTDLITQRPEFVKVVYGDQFGKEILDNLRTIGKGITQAAETGAGRVAETKAAGKAAVAGAEGAGAKSVEEATAAARRANLEARQSALESRRQRAIASKQDVEAATRHAEGELKTTVGTEAPKVAGAQQAVKSLKEGSMGRYLAGGKGMLADVAAVAASGYHPIVGARAGARLAAQLFVHSPAAPDLIAAASHSSQTSQLVAKALTGQLAGPKVMMLARALGKATLRAPKASSQGARRERQEASAQEEEPQAVNQ
jgi:hypothetical protein